MEFYWDIVCDECKRFNFPKELWGVPEVTEIKISCQNNVNIAVTIVRSNHVEGGGDPGMYINGYTRPSAIEERPKGSTGFLKIGANLNLWKTI